MHTKEDADIDHKTKKAWDDNWGGVEIKDVLEIFKYPRVQKQLEIYMKYLPKNKKILEGGCGLGPYLIYLHNAGYDVIGIDYNEEPLKKIKEHDSSLEVRVMDVRELKFPDGYFGGYLSLGVIEHFTEGPIKAIKEAHRVLSPGGYFIVQIPRFSIFNLVTYPFDILKRNNVLRKIFRRRQKTYYWQQHFRIKDISRALADNGFRIIETKPIDHEHALMAFCSIFRDKNTYDGATRLAVYLSSILEKYMPWSTAAEMIIVCIREQ